MKELAAKSSNSRCFPCAINTDSVQISMLQKKRFYYIANGILSSVAKDFRRYSVGKTFHAHLVRGKSLEILWCEVFLNILFVRDLLCYSVCAKKLLLKEILELVRSSSSLVRKNNTLRGVLSVQRTNARCTFQFSFLYMRIACFYRK